MTEDLIKKEEGVGLLSSFQYYGLLMGLFELRRRYA